MSPLEERSKSFRMGGTPYEQGIPSTHQVYFHEEIKSIYPGWRGVVLLSVGPKWAIFRMTVTGQKLKVRRAVWNRMKRREQ